MGINSTKLKRSKKRFASIDNLDIRAQEKKSEFSRGGLYRSSKSRWKFGSVGSSLNRAGKPALPWPDCEFVPEFDYKEDEINNFEIQDIIANGAFGNVMKGRDVKSGQIIAIKMLNKARVIVEAAVQQVKDEASVQFAVGHHPFIVQTLGYWQSKKDLYIVMDHIAHGELFLLWQIEEKFSEEVVKVYIAELALVVDFLHQNHIVYRDIKMENILLDDGGHVQVIDFGLSKWLKRGEKTNTVCGTLQYMAPEVLSSKPYTHAVDWWSLGVLMYAMLAGTYPLADIGNHEEMAAAMAEHDYDQRFPEIQSWEARDVIGKLLQKDPRKRCCKIEQLEKQEFFDGVDFTAVLRRQTNPRSHLSSAMYFQDLQKKRKQNGIRIRYSGFQDFSWTTSTHQYGDEETVAL